MVLAIVAVMLLAVGLSVDSGGPARRVAVEAQRLAALMQLACDESAQFGQDTGVRFEANGYQFVRAVGQQWQPRSSDALRARRLPEGMRIDVQIGERVIDLDAGDTAADDDASGAGIEAGASDVSASSEGLAPHLACDAEGALTGPEPRIEISAGNRSALLVAGGNEPLRVADAEQRP